MARYTAPVAMRWNDMDAYGHVNNVVFLQYLEEARIEMFAGLAEEAQLAGDEAILSRGVVVASSSIDYLRPLVHRTEPVPIDVWVSRIGGASFHLGYEVHDEGGGVVYARARSVMVPYDFVRETPRRITPREREFLQKYLEPDVDDPRAPAVRRR
ncbi:MAG: acyl-CoA thioesterase [Actinomycetota bacterium]|nr:acyl-CoA thioesterase [Actinomycetota bacterium]